ncbi:MAG TPA: M12 family metallopeptidase [Candidatus Sulfopaludibacter sp.]|nr:M12 family metallopeptidase [Candidatus Sulfopaludibacter sp.]
MKKSEGVCLNRGFSKSRAPILIWLCGLVWLSAAGSAFAGNYFGFVSPTNVPWPGGTIPYLFDTNYTITPAEKSVIITGLREWELAANVHFVPYTNQANYVLLQFTNDGSGSGYCLLGTPATIMLHGLARGLMCHEGGHLLGLQHEHQRVDRNNFITVNLANVTGGTNGEGAAAFLIDSNSISFGSYDLQSVMHYTPETFTNGLGDSLDPLPPYWDYYHKLGNLALSIGDRAAVANLYGPPATPLTNVVTTTADGGFGSLRAAIYYANDHPGTTIKFNIPNTDPGYSNGVYAIYLIGEPPPLVSPNTIIDGTTQPGYAGQPVIVLDGSEVSPEAGALSGAHLYGTNCTVRALAFDNFNYSGLQLFAPDAASNSVQGCYIGLKSDGATAAPNNFAGVIFQYGAHNNVIGGTNASQRNTISGNIYYGIQINDTNSNGNVIDGNYIGLNAAGTASVTNGYSGIGIWNGPVATVIGGTSAGARNVISGNYYDGVNLSYANVSGVVIQGNYIGTDFTGSNAVPNGQAGVDVFSGANGMIIGGSNAAARNIISGNGYTGVILNGAGVTNNLVAGNYVGTDPSGEHAVPNQIGIGVWGGATGNWVGGTGAGAANVASGNRGDGILVSDPGTSNNLVQGNLVGTDPAGKIAVANGDIGVVVQSGADHNLIGGLVPGAGNLISGNTNYGLVIINGQANVVQGNLIGTDMTGTNALPNKFTGAAVWGGATGNLIGGTAAGAGNVISGNATYGFFISDTNTSGNFVEGNLVGTDATGKKALANGFAGISVFGEASANTIGGTVAGAGNLASGNGSYGVFLSDTNTTGNLVEGNLIGTDITGTNALGNGSANVELQNGATGNFIGGINAGAGNVIAYSGGAGVLLYNPGTTNNAIRGNSIFSNGELGINFDNSGVVANHTGFLAGPNDFQNYPVITNAVAGGSSTTVSGTLNSTPNGSFLIDVYRNIIPDPSDYGEGQVYVGTAALATDGSGNGAFALTVAGDFAGQNFAATATAANGDTSEFSADFPAVAGPAAQFTGPFQSSSTNGFAFHLTLQTNFSYHIQTTTNLAAPIVWVNLTNFTATNSPLTFTDHSATNYRVRFYRVVSP